MSSTFKWATNILVGAVVVTILSTFLLSRALIFSGAYKRATIDQVGNEYMRGICETHANVARYQPDMCSKVHQATEFSPWTTAMTEVIAQTHSCGQWPCSTLYGLVLEKTNSTLFNIILALGLLLFVYVVAVRFIGGAMHTAQAKQYVGTHSMMYNAPSQIEGGGMEALRQYRYEPDDGRQNIRLLDFKPRRSYTADVSD